MGRRSVWGRVRALRIVVAPWLALALTAGSSTSARAQLADPAAEARHVAHLLDKVEHGRCDERDVAHRLLGARRLDSDPRVVEALVRRRARDVEQLLHATALDGVYRLREQYRVLQKLRVDALERLRGAPLDEPLDVEARAAVTKLIAWWSASERLAVEPALAEAFDDYRWCTWRLERAGETEEQRAERASVPDWIRFSAPSSQQEGDECWLTLASYGECARDLDATDPSCRTARHCGPPIRWEASPPLREDDAWIRALSSVRVLFGTRLFVWNDGCKEELESRRTRLRVVIAEHAERGLAAAIQSSFGEVPNGAGRARRLGRTLVVRTPGLAKPPVLAELVQNDAVLRFAALWDLSEIATLVCDEGVVFTEWHVPRVTGSVR